MSDDHSGVRGILCRSGMTSATGVCSQFKIGHPSGAASDKNGRHCSKGDTPGTA